MAVFMAIDAGTTRIGVALCDSMEISIRSLEPVAVKSREDAALRVAKLVEIHNPATVVVGLPVSLDGSRGPMAKKAEKFARCLEEKISAPVVMMDERFSTVEAQKILVGADLRRDRRKQVIDGVAASIILQKYIQSRNQEGETNHESS